VIAKVYSGYPPRRPVAEVQPFLSITYRLKIESNGLLIFTISLLLTWVHKYFCCSVAYILWPRGFQSLYLISTPCSSRRGDTSKASRNKNQL